MTVVARAASINDVKTCSNCRNRVAAAVPVCPFCGARLHGEASRVGGIAAEKMSETVVLGEVVTPSKYRLTFGIAAAVIVVMGVGLYLLRPPRFPVADVKSETAVLCEAADWCLIAYLSPWDDASARTYKLLDRVRSALPDGVALEVVWGAGHPADLEAMAERHGKRGFTDPSGAIVEQFALVTVPSWFLVDAQGRAVEQMDGTYMPIGYHLHKLGLATYGPQ